MACRTIHKVDNRVAMIGCQKRLVRTKFSVVSRCDQRVDYIQCNEILHYHYGLIISVAHIFTITNNLIIKSDWALSTMIKDYKLYRLLCQVSIFKAEMQRL